MEGHHHANTPEWRAEAGSGLVVAGALLLLFDAVALMFVPSDIAAGTHFFEAGFAVIGLLAVILIGVGRHKRAKAEE